MSLLFISDLHLDPKRPAITQAFYHFLETKAQQVQALYILGDFFEAWLGDDDDTPLYQEVIEKLHTYSTQDGHQLYFMHGNRDFLAGEDFAQRCQATLLNDPYVLSYNHSNYLLMHGDSLCTKDVDYLAFRKMARSTQWQQQFLGQPIEQRRQIVAEIQDKSQTMKSLKAADIMDVTEEEVIRIMEEHNVHNLIHGHTHRPNKHTLTIKHNTVDAERWVLGDWGEKGWYIEIDDSGPSLISFDI